MSSGQDQAVAPRNSEQYGYLHKICKDHTNLHANKDGWKFHRGQPLDKESVAVEERTGLPQRLTPNPKRSALNTYIQAALTGLIKLYMCSIHNSRARVMSSRGDRGRVGVEIWRDINDANSAFMHETPKNQKSKTDTEELC